MPAQGGRAYQQARLNKARGQRFQPQGAHVGGGAPQINQGGINVTTSTHLAQRAHRPGREASDPRWAAAAFNWGAATHTNRGERWATSGFREGGRWWEGNTLYRPTDITETSEAEGHPLVRVDPNNWMSGVAGEGFLQRQRERWGDVYGDPFNLYGMTVNPFTGWEYNPQEAGGSTGSGFF